MRRVNETVKRNIEEFLGEKELAVDALYHTVNSKVVWRDDTNILRDFPDLNGCNLESVDGQNIKKIPDLVREESDLIDCWVRYYGGCVSQAQLSQNVVSGTVEVHDSSLIAFRPPRYGRASVIPVSSNPLFRPETQRHLQKSSFIDVKGCGVAPGVTPLLEPAKSGLLPLYKAIAEVVHGKILDHAFMAANVSVRSLPSYAIVSLGFMENRSYSKPMPAATLVRRAHRRPEGNIDLPFSGSDEAKIQLAIEAILRDRGITSTSPKPSITILSEDERLVVYLGGKPVPEDIDDKNIRELLRRLNREAPQRFSAINLQLTRESVLEPLTATIVDLGAFDAIKDVHNDGLLLVRDAPFNFGPILHGDSNESLQWQSEYKISVEKMRRRKLQTDMELWGGFSSEQIIRAAEYFGLEMTRLFERNKLSSAFLSEQIENYVGSVGNHRELMTAAEREIMAVKA